MDDYTRPPERPAPENIYAEDSPPNPAPPVRRQSPLYEMAMLIVLVLMGLFVGNFFGLVLALPFVDFNVNALIDVLNNLTSNPDSKNILLLMQGVSALCAFVLAPLLFIRLIARQPVSSLNATPHVWLAPALLTALLIITFMPFNALFIEWNNSVQLPEVFSGFEKWAQEKEESLKELTEYLTTFDNIPQLLAGFVVIALLPAIGEELLFRGILQPRVQRLTRNVHAAVWITGFVFSAIHFQFYGLIPRMLLGVVLGYLYAWSGNLWYPIIGHFTNNGFTLLLVYLYHNQAVGVDIEDTAAVPVSVALISFVVSAGILYTLRTKYFSTTPNAIQSS